MTSLLLAILFLSFSHVKSFRRLDSGGSSDYFAECLGDTDTIDCQHCKKLKDLKDTHNWKKRGYCAEASGKDHTIRT